MESLAQTSSLERSLSGCLTISQELCSNLHSFWEVNISCWEMSPWDLTMTTVQPRLFLSIINFLFKVSIFRVTKKLYVIYLHQKQKAKVLNMKWMSWSVRGQPQDTNWLKILPPSHLLKLCSYPVQDHSGVVYLWAFCNVHIALSQLSSQRMICWTVRPANSAWAPGVKLGSSCVPYQIQPQRCCNWKLTNRLMTLEVEVKPTPAFHSCYGCVSIEGAKLSGLLICLSAAVAWER